MSGFLLGWVISSFWGVLLVPIYIVKSAFAIPLDS